MLGFEGFRATPDEITMSSLRKRGTRNKLINSEGREISASRRLCGRIGNRLACVKCSNAHTVPTVWSYPMLAVNDMHNRRALVVIIERSTIPVRVFIVAPNGVDPTSTEITSRSIGREQPPGIKHDRRIQAVSLRPPLTLPTPAAAKVTHVPSTGKDAQLVNDVVDHAFRNPGCRQLAPADSLLPTDCPAR